MIQGLNDASLKTVKEAARFVKSKLPDRGKDYRVALVVSQDLVYGFVRMYEVFVQNLSFRMKTFRNYEEAFTWVANKSKS